MCGKFCDCAFRGRAGVASGLHGRRFNHTQEGCSRSDQKRVRWRKSFILWVVKGHACVWNTLKVVRKGEGVGGRGKEMSRAIFLC
jgi:hypothetical protein